MSIFEDRISHLLTVATSEAGMGETCSFVALGGSPASFDFFGIFDKNFASIDAGAQVPIQTRAPAVGVKLSDITDTLGRDPSSAGEGGNVDKVVIRSITYRIIQVEPDARGNVYLILHKDA